MKLSRDKLHQIIQEEYSYILKENAMLLNNMNNVFDVLRKLNKLYTKSQYSDDYAFNANVMGGKREIVNQAIQKLSQKQPQELSNFLTTLHEKIINLLPPPFPIVPSREDLKKTPEKIQQFQQATEQIKNLDLTADERTFLETLMPAIKPPTVLSVRTLDISAPAYLTGPTGLRNR